MNNPDILDIESVRRILREGWSPDGPTVRGRLKEKFGIVMDKYKISRILRQLMENGEISYRLEFKEEIKELREEIKELKDEIKELGVLIIK